jgi:DNA-binding transcriptional regulator YbjK
VVGLSVRKGEQGSEARMKGEERRESVMNHEADARGGVRGGGARASNTNCGIPSGSGR